MLKNLILCSMLTLSSCAFYNVYECEDAPIEQEKLNKMFVSAIKSRDDDLVEFVAASSPDITAVVNTGINIGESDIYPLWYAIVNDMPKTIDLLFANGADINKCNNDTDGNRCITLLAYMPSKETVELLIKNGFDVNSLYDNLSFLDIFIRSNPTDENAAEFTKYIVSKGAKLYYFKDDKEMNERLQRLLK